MRSRPDLVLLDVQMPELDGFEVVQRLPESALPAVIFVTAFDRSALRAFDVHAIDYLLKPFTRERRFDWRSIAPANASAAGRTTPAWRRSSRSCAPGRAICHGWLSGLAAA